MIAAGPQLPVDMSTPSNRISGFSLTHLMGTGCAGASGDIPFMPYVGEVTSSPADDADAEIYGSTFSHDNEIAKAGYYKVKLDNGVIAELTATLRTGSGRFTYPAGQAGGDAGANSEFRDRKHRRRIHIDPKTRTISGSVTSGNFCGYLGTADRRSYYTLYFVAHFDTAFRAQAPGRIRPCAQHLGSPRRHNLRDERICAAGQRAPEAGSHSIHRRSSSVGVRVGISYVSEQNAEANLRAENPEGTAFDTVREKAHAAWNEMLNRVEITRRHAR